MDTIDPELRPLDGAIRDAAQPDAGSLARVRSRLRSGRPGGEEGGPGAGGRALPPWWRYAAAGAAVLVLVVAAVLAGAAIAGRQPDRGLTATVVPPAASGTTGASAAGAPGVGAAPDVASDAKAAVGTAAGVGSSASQAIAAPSSSLPFVGSSCSASPTVQFQGRGLAATGAATITGSEQVGSLSVSVRQTAGDLASAVAAAQAKLTAVRDALGKAGVPASSQTSSFSTYGDTRQFTAYASLQATVTGTDALVAATNAVAQVPGVSAYSSSSTSAGRATPEQEQDAVGKAAAQARATAASTATAAGVKLGDVQSLVVQPPAMCYGPTGPERLVQVTVMYALR